MKKIAIFWGDTFNLNNFKIDKNLNAYGKLLNINGTKNTCLTKTLKNKKDKKDYLILCFLTLSIFTIIDYIKLFLKFPRNKKYFIIYEPIIISKLNYNKIFHSFFKKVYTRNDNLVDNKKYFHFIIPSSLNGISKYNICYSKKKLLTLINGNHNSNMKNELYSKRKSIINYLEENNIEFDLYGRNWNKPINILEKIFGFHQYKSYKGTVKNKIEILSKYKFNICFENMSNIPGNITEKIWDSFKAKSVPIYWGASNITEYIPENCFIDYRKFKGNNEKLIKYILNISEYEYNIYIKNIETFLTTKKVKKWFDEEWAINFLKSL